MHKAKIDETPLRFDTYGPGYLARGPRTDFGVVVLPPGQDFPNHYHERTEETFYTLEGHVVMWTNGLRIELGPGDYHRCDPMEMHYLVNEGEVPWRAVFIKAPHNPGDGVTVDWKPGQPVPDIGPRLTEEDQSR
ncbi:cupin domain-containing protein [Deinococcus alpinitundrae]|uniref:cupin domain-containing protein n=1 Tax=Deinococcus alpinitundrae TaxID=468913 RepID=UPI00137A48BC|nr:cupin domain-containing protein [Deinococcus alpinitundrae]